MIKSFKDKESEKVFNGQFSKKLPQDIQRIAERKLIMIHHSANLNDLQIPPSNRLEVLKGNRKGQHSQWFLQDLPGGDQSSTAIAWC